MNKRPLKMQIALLALLVVVMGAAMFAVNPFKVTDPSKPGFNPDKFSFRDYDDGLLPDAYKTLFPVGTPKEFVDRVLMSAGKATSGKINGEANGGSIWGYRQPANSFKGGRQDLFLFDSKDNVVNISISGNTKLYSDQPDLMLQE